MEPTKYPRTWHLPWSPGLTRDDKRIPASLLGSLETKEVVVTEKLDGENTTLYTSYLHARSLDSNNHPSRNWLKGMHSRLGYLIPDNLRICGENVYAKHSIAYDQLPSYFLVFSVWEDDLCLSWDATVEWCERLGLEHVPVLYRGPWDEAAVRACWTGVSQFGPDQEGYVVRDADQFFENDGEYPDGFIESMAKYVRTGHVPTDEHWSHGPIIPNGLKSSII